MTRHEGPTRSRGVSPRHAVPFLAGPAFGRVLAGGLRTHRDELVISTRAGYDMWPGPYGDLGFPQVPPGQSRPEPAPVGRSGPDDVG